MQKITLKSVLAIVLIMTHLFLITACDKNPSDTEEEPPTLPPANSMQIDLSLFDTNSGNTLAKGNAVSQKHFTTAVITVGLINMGVLAGMTVPIAIFAQALSADPELQSDGKFHWMYTDTVWHITYSVDLAGWPRCS